MEISPSLGATWLRRTTKLFNAKFVYSLQCTFLLQQDGNHLKIKASKMTFFLLFVVASRIFSVVLRLATAMKLGSLGSHFMVF